MELRETIESINYKLEKEYGKAFNEQPNFRVVFSEDQFEKRLTNYSDTGFELLVPEVRLLPKYRQYIHAKYVLERLIPVVGETDLMTQISYEPAWVFQDKDGGYLPPFFDGCRLVIDSLYAQMDRHSGFVRYKDESVSPEARKQKLLDVQKELFGDETEVGDALAYGYGVTDFNPKTSFTENEGKEGEE